MNSWICIAVDQEASLQCCTHSTFSKSVTVSVAVFKLGWTNLTFVEHGAVSLLLRHVADAGAATSICSTSLSRHRPSIFCTMRHSSSICGQPTVLICGQLMVLIYGPVDYRWAWCRSVCIEYQSVIWTSGGSGWLMSADVGNNIPSVRQTSCAFSVAVQRYCSDMMASSRSLLQFVLLWDNANN